MTEQTFRAHCAAWIDRANRDQKHLDALIRSYLVFMWTRVPETVVEDGRRIFGVMSRSYRQCAEEVGRLMELQR